MEKEKILRRELLNWIKKEKNKKEIAYFLNRLNKLDFDKFINIVYSLSLSRVENRRNRIATILFNFMVEEDLLNSYF